MTAYEERPLYPEQILRELKRLQGLLGYLRSEVEKAITLIRVGFLFPYMGLSDNKLHFMWFPSGTIILSIPLYGIDDLGRPIVADLYRDTFYSLIWDYSGAVKLTCPKHPESFLFPYMGLSEFKLKTPLSIGDVLSIPLYGICDIPL